MKRRDSPGKWLQIMAGWLLSAVFIAGLTGLIQND
jgi:hypothetical protein